MGNADKEDALPPLGSEGQGEEPGDGGHDQPMDQNALQFATFPLRQAIPLQYKISHQVGEEHGDYHFIQ